MSGPNKINNVIYSGWMMKSPPESRFRFAGPWKIFRSKWKRRYFVLFKPASSLPHQYLLNYYTDENCRRLKGCIDLEHCEQVIESLDVEIYNFLLALKTSHKGKERTYFLAAETEDEMTAWVRNLCSVCGLKPEDSPDLPPGRDSELHPTTNHSAVITPPRSIPLSTQSRPASSTLPRDLHSRDTVVRPVARSNSHYIPISECRSEPPARRDSIPDEMAPPPPPMKAPKPLPPIETDDSDVFHQPYDMPKNVRKIKPQQVDEDEDEDDDNDDHVYKVPPPRRHDKEETLDVYDVPPPTKHSPSSPRSSSSESQTADSAYSSQPKLVYDYPPSHTGEKIPTSDDVYDVPPSNPQLVSDMNTSVPPPRPPKVNSANLEPYQNLPPNSKMHQDFTDMNWNKVVPPSAMQGLVQSYDVPKAQNMLNQMSVYDMPKSNNPVLPDSSLSCIPPPAHLCMESSHSYVNATKGYVIGTKSFPDKTAVNYLDMSGRPQEGYVDVSGHHPDYDMPPPRIQPVSQGPQVPPRASPRAKHVRASEPQMTVWSNARTRSFKRGKTQIYDSKGNGPSMQAYLDVGLPSRLDSGNPDCSTSSEDEDQVLGEVSQVMMPFSALYKGNQLWNSSVPPPKQQDTELKYADLALESAPEPIRAPQPHGNNSPPTEYREIDFQKTEALSDLIKTRKHDDS